MGATARIMAWMGMDASQFKAGVDGATKHLKGMEVSMSSIRKMSSVMFGLAMVDRVISQYKELKSYQDRTGVKLMSDDDMEQLDAAANAIEKLQMRLVAFVSTALGQFIQGWAATRAEYKSFVFGLGEGNQAMVNAIEDTTELTKQTELLAKAIEKLKVEKYKALTPVWEQIAAAYEKMDSLRKQRRGSEGGLAAIQGQGLLKQEASYKRDIAAIDEEILRTEAEIRSLNQKRNQEAEQGDAARKTELVGEQKTRAEAEHLNEERAKGHRLAVEYGQVRASEDENVIKRKQLELEAEQALAKLSATKSGGAYIDESKDAYTLRIQVEKNNVLKAQLALTREIAAQEKDAADKKKDATKKLEDELKEKREKAEKTQKAQLAVLKQGQKDVEGITGGSGIGRRELGVGGGELQSIGGYFASQGAVRMAQGTRAERVQDEIKTITAKMAEDIARIANPDGGG